MAVRPAERRRGTGTPLLLAALRRMAGSGRKSAQISWVGPLAFYAKTVGATISRTFFVYRQDR
jgi:predicted N-acetyltransferase YhbS